MNKSGLEIQQNSTTLSLDFFGDFTLYQISKYEVAIEGASYNKYGFIEINLKHVTLLDTAAALYLHSFVHKLDNKHISHTIITDKKETLDTINLTKRYHGEVLKKKKEKKSCIHKLGSYAYKHILSYLAFISFLGKLFSTKLYTIKNISQIRFKEIFFEINESGIKAIPIIALTSFLIGLVVAFQSAHQLKLYGANIFIVDMLGLSILRELAPVITAIVIAGRSGSAFTAQIGAMKITQELDAMRTMGFDPYMFLVLPRIIALMITMPILIFLADIMGILGGMIVANTNLGISTDMFLSRFLEVIHIQNFYVGIFKGPFFAFLIASIGIYRGLIVKDDTQSIGFNTTKSVVESIFAVIVCDALFSIAFTNLGI